MSEQKQWTRLQTASVSIVIILCISMILFTIISLDEVFGANSHFGITLSKTCLTMLQNNVSGNCPTYYEINQLFPDTSNRLVSGDFAFIDGMYQRDHTKFKNHFAFYDYWNEDVRWVDPPGDVRLKIRLITITPHDFEYKIGSQTITNSSYVIGKSRYVSQNCDEAIITGDNWIFLLGDTIQYLESGCTKTNFDEIKLIQWEKTIHDIKTSYKYQLDKWYEEAKQKSKGRIIYEKNQTAPP